jgi:Glycosyl transferases group 1
LDKHLHIITLDVPLPANYGGAIDMFCKIVALHRQGIKIHLHCFSGGRQPQDDLDQYCETVQYYPRRKFPQCISLGLPYIVSSRVNKDLLKNLLQNDYPIFMEGVHCTYLLYKGKLKGRRVFVRPHNVEFSYYDKLARNEDHFFRKLYFRTESFFLKRYEKKIARKNATFWPLSMSDTEVYKNLLQAKNIDFLPVFLPWNEVQQHHGKGCFCLYHGNLSVNENEKAAMWLLKEVFNNIPIPLVIAGKSPSEELEEMAYINKNTCLVANPSDAEMQDLIKKAQVNILPSFNNTGVKLKLLNALFNGRHCLVNPAAAEGAVLDGLCELATTAEEFKVAATKLYEQSFDQADLVQRQQVLNDIYSNEKNALQLITWIF